jgi:hydroxymethylbilane synthase
MSETRVSVLRVATRGSALALKQTELVVEALRALRPDLTVEIVAVRTAGDRNQTAPVTQLGDGAFVRGVEAALLDGRADIAVHSAKDIPSTESPGLTLAAFPPRGDPRDALVSRDGRCLAELPRGARVGTGSPRRRALLHAVRPDLEVVPARGNVDTRLRRLREGAYDALILAAVGLERLGLGDVVTEYLDPTLWVPAAGQGALAVQCRTDSSEAVLAAALDHPPTRAAVVAERAVLRRLGSGCRVPVGVHGRVEHGKLAVRGVLLAPDGSRSITAERTGAPAEAEALGRTLAEDLLRKGSDLLD